MAAVGRHPESVDQLVLSGGAQGGVKATIGGKRPKATKEGHVSTSMPGNIVAVLVQEGDMVTAGQLSVAFPDPVGGIAASFLKFAGVFALTQIPLAVSEGLLSVVVYNTLLRYNEQGLIHIWWKGEEHKA